MSASASSRHLDERARSDKGEAQKAFLRQTSVVVYVSPGDVDSGGSYGDGGRECCCRSDLAKRNQGGCVRNLGKTVSSSRQLAICKSVGAYESMRLPLASLVFNVN